MFQGVNGSSGPGGPSPETRCFPEILFSVAGLLLLRGGEVGGRLVLALSVWPVPEVLSPPTSLVTKISPEVLPLFFRSVSKFLLCFLVWAMLLSVLL